jgi:hypothetical protein
MIKIFIPNGAGYCLPLSVTLGRLRFGQQLLLSGRG